MKITLTPRRSFGVRLTGAAGQVFVGAQPAALQLVSIVRVGPRGAQGDPGPQGPAGSAGFTRGSTTLDFGAWPGDSFATADVTGQSGILSGATVRAWIVATSTADHSADEHCVAPLRVTAGSVVAGTGFTIFGFYEGFGLTHGQYSVAWEWSN